jgi:CRISPR system Cascade subunit CasE
MTLWLTRIQLNLRDNAVRTELANAVQLHKRLMSLMPDDLGEHARQQTKLLYRIDETRTGTQILAQSVHPPDIAKLPPAYGSTAIRNLDPLLAALEKGVSINYRLAGNACKRLGRTAEHPGKLVALRGQAAEEWWLRRAERCGLHVNTMTATSMADISGRRRDADPKDRVRHGVVRYDGIATITDPNALRQAVHDGVGHGKAHGCGLLSLALGR